MIHVETAQRQLLLGYLAALGAAFCYGSVTLVGRKIVTEFAPPMVGTAFSMLFGTIILGLLVHRHAIVDVPRATRRGLLMVGLAGLASTFGVSFWFLALNESRVVLVAPLVGTSPLLSIALTHFFLQRLERVTWRTVSGAVLVVFGAALVVIGGSR